MKTIQYFTWIISSICNTDARTGKSIISFKDPIRNVVNDFNFWLKQGSEKKYFDNKFQISLAFLL